MRIGKVVGSVVATKKEEELLGCKIMVVKFQDSKGQDYGYEEVAVDYVGAGIGELVLVAAGSAVRTKATKTNKPIDLAIVGIIDTVQ